MKSSIIIQCVLFFSLIDILSVKNKHETVPPYVIAYNVAVKDSTGKSNYEVFTMAADGSGKTNITKSPDVAWTYRAKGTDLYFISDRNNCYRCFHLFKSDYKGNSVQKVSDLQLEDSWMDTRNGGKEMIVSGRIGKEIRYQLFLIDLEKGTHRQITTDTAAMYSDPAFSPDGKQVVFSYRKNKRDKNQHEELFLMEIDGNEIKQLTHYPEANISKNDYGYKAGSAHWHPTENYITYISKQDGRSNIFAVSPDGKKQWKLTDNNFSEGWHDWTEDGNWLTFDMANEDESQYHIMLMNWETKVVTQLTDDTYQYQMSPVFVKIK